MFKPIPGVSLVSICDELDEPTFSVIENSGLRTLEIKQTTPKIHARNRPFLKRFSKVKPRSVHAAFGGDIDVSSPDKGVREKGMRSLSEALDLAEDLGAELLVMHPSLEPIDPLDREGRKQFSREAIAAMAGKCARKGVRLAVELLPRTCLGNTADELLELVGGLPSRTVGVCVDTNHLMDKPESLPEVVEKLADRLFATHLSDYDGVDEKHWLPGKGVVDWPAFIEALKNAGYSGTLNYEINFRDEGTPAERVALVEESFRKIFLGK